MKTLKFLSYSVVFGLLVSCTGQPEGTDAEVGEAQEVAETSVSAVSYTIDTSDSQVGWIGYKPTGKHNGTIPVTDGSIAVEDGTIQGGTITMSVADIQNEDLADDPDNQGKLLGHLKSPDFFDAENHPTATFEITSVEAYNPDEMAEVKEEYETEYTPVEADEYRVDSPTHKITGNLTMRGNTLSISFPANVQMSEDGISATAKFNIDRTNWGVSFRDEASVADKAKDQFIYNTVNVSFDLKATAAPEAM
jgi:polyisoprenoid-binding protein YceI